MKPFVKPHLEKDTEFKLHGKIWVVDEIFQDYRELFHPVDVVKYHLKDSLPNGPRISYDLNDLYEELWKDSDEYQASKLVEELKHIEYKVGTFTDISEEDKCEIRELISKIKNKLK